MSNKTYSIKGGTVTTQEVPFMGIPDFDLRDWIAGNALSGLIANYGIGPVGRSSPNELAADAYRAADAMLRAREAKP